MPACVAHCLLWGSAGAAASRVVWQWDHSAAALVQIRAGQEFSDATALMESAKVKRKPLLLKKKIPCNFAKTKQFQYEPARFPAGSLRKARCSEADSGEFSPWSLPRIYILERKSSCSGLAAPRLPSLLAGATSNCYGEKPC